MTRRYYELLAAALKNARPARVSADMIGPDFSARDCTNSQYVDKGWKEACKGIADALAKDNPRFERERFLTNCGISE